LGKKLEPQFKFSDFVRISAFTCNGVESVPMWAHYANNHKGFCVSYSKHVKENGEIFARALPVEYREERIDITDIIFELLIVSSVKQMVESKGQKKFLEENLEIDDITLSYISMLLYNIKHKVWAHEKEIRCAVQKNETSNIQHLPAIPKEIFIGTKCSPKHARELFNIANELNVPFYGMLKPENNDPRFKLVCHPINSESDLEKYLKKR
jgi:hypothetical protein